MEFNVERRIMTGAEGGRMSDGLVRRNSTNHRIVFGDSRHMDLVDNESIQLVVTSPPYWSIKDYDHPDQIGHGQSYEDYLADLERVLMEIRRVLSGGCRAAINIGDQYLRATEHGRYRVQPIPADIICVARRLGFDFMGNIIWRKISTTKTSGGGQWMGSTYHPRDGHITYEHEYIILLKKPGNAPSVSEEQRERSRLTKEQRSEWFRGVWSIHPDRQEEHGAMFPVEVPRRLIKMYSFWGETVLDPFLGSGTTSLAAKIEGRHSIGVEINTTFETVIRRKLAGDSGNLFDDSQVLFVTAEANPKPVAALVT
jgi:site-specific DNA-methyltransferase (adenine-specific)